jgi:hypothetical protein
MRYYKVILYVCSFLFISFNCFSADTYDIKKRNLIIGVEGPVVFLDNISDRKNSVTISPISIYYGLTDNVNLNLKCSANIKKDEPKNDQDKNIVVANIAIGINKKINGGLSLGAEYLKRLLNDYYYVETSSGNRYNSTTSLQLVVLYKHHIENSILGFYGKGSLGVGDSAILEDSNFPRKVVYPYETSAGVAFRVWEDFEFTTGVGASGYLDNKNIFASSIDLGFNYRF